MTLLCLNMKENKATRNKSNFVSSSFWVFEPFWPYLVWAKKCLHFKNQISKILLITIKTNFVTPNYVFVWAKFYNLILILIKYLFKKVWVKFDLKCGLYNGGPIKNSFLRSFDHFQEINSFPKKFYRSKKKFRSMPMNGRILGSRIRPFKLIFNLNIEKHKT